MKNLFLPFAIAFTVLNTSLMVLTGFNLGNDAAMAETNKWNPQLLDSVREGCVEGVTQSTVRKASLKEAKEYCSCFVNAVATRFEPTVLQEDPKKIANQLAKDGIIQKCLQSVPSEG
jgi:hypothetical protein